MTLQEHLEPPPDGAGDERALSEADPPEPTRMMVAVHDIKEYDRNPRRERNAAYEDLKASLQSRGFTGVLPITRRPGDREYMVAEGGNTVLRIVKELYAETGDPKFQRLPCLFEPWKSDPEVLIAHLIENDARSDLLFIDRARAVRELRTLLEADSGERLSDAEITRLLRERGYALNPSALSRMAYALEMLFPVIPRALRAGLGQPAIDRLRKLEATLVAFLEDRQQAPAVIETVRQGFLVSLARHDGPNWVLEPVLRQLEMQLAEACGESLAQVRADFAAIEQTGKPAPEASTRVPFTPLESSSIPPRAPMRPPRSARVPGDEEASLDRGRGSPRRALSAVHKTLTGDGGVGTTSETPTTTASVCEAAEAAAVGPPLSGPLTALMDVKSLRSQMWTLATQLAGRHGLGECILPCQQGAGFLVDLPRRALYTGASPESAEEARRVTLWWMLSGLSEQWPYVPDREGAPALRFLKNARIYPAIEAIATGDECTATEIVIPLVSEPPSLDIASRQLFAAVDDQDFALLVRLLDARRALQHHCRRLGKKVVWDL
jgi:ParB family protein of integrating conjugative element (PFGI_1 class)